MRFHSHLIFFLNKLDIRSLMSISYKCFFSQEYPVLFKIHVVDSGVKDCYLPTDVDMPLYTEAIDRYATFTGEVFKIQTP